MERTPTEFLPLKRWQQQRKQAYELRHALRPHSRSRVAKCGWTPIDPNVTVMLKDGRAYFGGIMTCGSVWECPACSLKIKSERARELQSAVEDYGVERCVMVTLTLRHSWGMEAKPLRQGLSDAWGEFIAGSGWKGALEDWSIKGFARALEVTHGPNGFHPHLHVLFFAERFSTTQLEELQRWLSDRWLRITLRRLGPDAQPDSAHVS